MKEYMTDEQMHEKLKLNDKTKENPILMKADKWKRLRLIELKKQGRNWSK